MPLVDEVNAQLKEAMKAKDKPRLTALRGIRAAIIEAQKQEGAGDTLPDEQVLGLLRKLAKNRQESIAAYAQGGRDDLVEAEQAELAIIEAFLPQLADEATTRAWAQQAIDAVGASGPSDMGKVMGRLMGAHKAEIDGKLAQQVVRELLAD